MQNTPDRNSSQDRKIARHFARMRDDDVRQAPPFPDAEVLAQRAPVIVESRFSAAIPKVAAAVVLAVAAGLFTLDTSTRDPGILYADIMDDSQLMTDPLLSVSPGTLPEMLESMDALDMELSLPELN